MDDIGRNSHDEDEHPGSDHKFFPNALATSDSDDDGDDDGTSSESSVVDVELISSDNEFNFTDSDPNYSDTRLRKG